MDTSGSERRALTAADVPNDGPSQPSTTQTRRRQVVLLLLRPALERLPMTAPLWHWCQSRMRQSCQRRRRLLRRSSPLRSQEDPAPANHRPGEAVLCGEIVGDRSTKLHLPALWRLQFVYRTYLLCIVQVVRGPSISRHNLHLQAGRNAHMSLDQRCKIRHRVCRRATGCCA